MVDSRGTEIVALTGLRGFAALWVFLYHAWGQSGMDPIAVALGDLRLDLTPLVRMGGAGVSIFFVLSGFLLALPFAEWQAGRRDRPATGRYLKHRVLRVFPAYYVQLALLLGIGLYTHGTASMPAWPDLVRHLLMLFMPPPLGVEPRNLVWWTLPIEFSFYLALPLLASMLGPRRLLLLVAISFGAMVAWRFLIVTILADAAVQTRVYASYQLPGSMDMFGMGMLAAVCYVNRAQSGNWLAAPVRRDAIVVASILLLVAATYWLNARASEYWANNPIFYLWTPTLSLAVLGIVLASAVGGRLAATLFGNRIMHFLGVVSYSVYLWHFPVLVWLKQAGLIGFAGQYRLVTAIALGLAATLAVSAASYYLVERPFIRLGRRT